MKIACIFSDDWDFVYRDMIIVLSNSLCYLCMLKFGDLDDGYTAFNLMPKTDICEAVWNFYLDVSSWLYV